MIRSLPRTGLVVALLAATVPISVHAQDTREATIAAEQAEKARQLAPYEPGQAEQIIKRAENLLLGDPNGFYPWFDSAYSGGGFTLGAGYRRFTGDRTFVDLRGLYSIKSYKRFEFVTTSLGLAHRHVNVQGIVGWRDATQVSFFGVGGDTSPDAKSNYGMQQGYVGGNVRITGPGLVVVNGAFQYEDYLTKRGSGSSPSIEQIFTPQTAPGLGENPSFLHSTIGGGIDSRRPGPGYARRGGLYGLTYDNWADVDDTFDFDQLTAEVVQHVPILRENWVLSFHGEAKTILDDADTAPYFLMPSLGSGSTLRAYTSWRFRDRHSLLMSGEFRWFPSRLAMDMAIFYDTGKVASRREDLNFTGLKDNIGVGVRFHAPAATPLRIELAHGSEGMNLVFSGAAAF